MKRLWRWWGYWDTVSDMWFAPVFAFFLLFGSYKDKAFFDRVRSAFRDAVRYDPIPVRDEEADRKARRKGRTPGQLADFDT